MKIWFIILSFFTMVSCNKDNSKKMQHGHWRGELQINDQENLPFNFEVTADKSLKVLNGEEVILVDEVTYRNDSIFIKMPVFDGYFAVRLTDEGMRGNYINDDMNMKMPFKAIYNVQDRFEIKEAPSADISGIWEVVFSPDSDQGIYFAKGIFEQDWQKVTGTFRTKIGDYRYLEGIMNGNELKMSAFDGAHAFLFVATVNDNKLNGVFYSGNSWRAFFEGKQNDDYELPDATTLTKMRDDNEPFAFSFPDEHGHIVSLTDKQFQDKVVVVQLMGTWCPNCLDESVFFSEFSKLNSEKDVEFVALAFETAKTDSLAFAGIKRLKDRLGIDYPILLAQHGTTDKIEAQKKLPMLTQVVSYPTTIFIDKKGKVRRIHTGFNGPATGEKYMEFKDEFIVFVNELLEE